MHSDSGDLRSGNVFRGFRVLWNLSYRTLCPYLSRRQHSHVCLILHHFLQWSSLTRVGSVRAGAWRQDGIIMKRLRKGWISLSRQLLLASNHTSHFSTQSHERFSLVPYNSTKIASLLFPTMIVYCESVFVSFIILKSMVLIHPMRYRNIIRQHLGLQSLLSPIIQDIRLLWVEVTSKPTYSIEFTNKIHLTNILNSSIFLFLFQNPFKYMNTVKRVLPLVTENALTLDLTKSVECLAWTLFL